MEQYIDSCTIALMPLRKRRGRWHYRFMLHGREHSASTGLDATERNRKAAQRVDAKAYELVAAGRQHELRLQIRSFDDAAAAFLTWAKGERAEHPATAKRLRTSFASLCRFSERSRSIRSCADRLRTSNPGAEEHKVREITIRHDLHALSPCV